MTNLTTETEDVVRRLRTKTHCAVRVAGGPTFVNPDGPEAADLIQSLSERIAVLEGALWDIESFTNGYGDVAGIACRMAAKALRPENFIDDASLTLGGNG